MEPESETNQQFEAKQQPGEALIAISFGFGYHRQYITGIFKRI